MIRIKVVQMLYAYLLTRTEFRIDTNPDNSGADKRFASAAYIDLLLLILELTGHNTSDLKKSSSFKIDRKLLASAVGKALAENHDVRDFVKDGAGNMDIIKPIIPELHDRILSTAIYKEYKAKRKFDIGDEVRMWTILLQSTIANDADLIEAFRKIPGYTNAGFNFAIERTVDTLMSYVEAKHGYAEALKNLEYSLRQAHKLYISMFVLIVRLTRERERQLDNAKHKFLATAEDKNPNTRFIDNAFARKLEQDPILQDFIKDYAIGWTDDFTLINTILDDILKSRDYEQYMALEKTDWNTDCEFWRNIMKHVIFQSDDLFDALENDSPFWNDDLHIIGTFVLKSIRIDASDPLHQLSFLPQFKDEEDARFGEELFRFSVDNRELYYSYVEQFVNTNNWESDRIAFMDTVIMICAIAEIVNFPAIPLPVSLNEYIDIANIYSSPKSGQFINGLLYSVVEHLKSLGIIHKQ